MKPPQFPEVFFLGLFTLSLVSPVRAQEAAADDDAEKEEEVAIIPIADIKRTEPVDFAKEIQPLLKKNCVACHNSSKSKGKLNLETPVAILKGGSEGPAVLAGKPDESLLLLSASHAEEPTMPPSGNKANAVDFTPEELGLIKLWIEQGAKGEASVVINAPEKWNSVDQKPIYTLDLSIHGRFAAAGRGNMVDIYETSSGRRSGRLIDPALKDKSHLDVVQSIAFSSRGLIATGGFRTIKLWSKPGQVVEKSFPALPDNITALIVSPDGKRAAAGDATGNVRIWNLDGEAKAITSKPHAGPVLQILFHPNGSHLVSSSTDKTVQFLNASDLKSISTLARDQPAGDIALLKNGTLLATTGTDPIIRLWNVPADLAMPELSITPARELPGHGKAVTGLARVKDQLVSFSAEDGQVKIWTPEDGKTIRTISHGAAMKAMVVTPDETRILTTGAKGEIKHWNVADGKAVATTPAGDIRSRQLVNDREQEHSVATRVAAERKKQMDEAAKKRDETAKDVEAKSAAWANAKIALDRKSREVTAASERLAELQAAKAPDAEVKKATEAHKKLAGEEVTAKRAAKAAKVNESLAVRMSSDAAKTYFEAQAKSKGAETLLAELKKDIDALKAKPVVLAPFSRVAASAGATTAVAVTDDGTFHISDLASGTPVDVISSLPTKSNVLASVTGGGGSRFLTGSEKSPILLRNLDPAWTLLRSIGDGKDAKQLIDRVTALAFSPDGSQIATGSGVPSRSGELKIWNVADGALVSASEEAHTDTIVGISFAPGGQYVATASTDRMAKVFRTADGTHVKTFEGHTAHVLDVAWRPDGLVLATAGADKQAKLWDFESGRQIKKEEGFSKEVTAVAFSSTSDSVLMASGDKNVKFNGQVFGGSTDFVHTAAITSDGVLVAAGGQDGALRIWRASDRKLLHSLMPQEK